MFALPFLDVAAATMARFDLAALSDAQSIRTISVVATNVRQRSPYRLPMLEDQSPVRGEHIRVRVHGRRVKLSMPFGPS